IAGSFRDAGVGEIEVEIDAAPVPVAVAPDAAPPEVAPSADASIAGPPEAEPDPAAAEDPDPEGKTVAAGSAGDEAGSPDEPTNPDDVEVHPPPPPKEHLAESIHGAVLLIEAGKRELALASLRAIWPHEKASAYVPFLLGNLYFDKHWWSVALVHYRIAI